LANKTILPEAGVVDQYVDLNVGARGLVEHVGGSSRIGEIDGEESGSACRELSLVRRRADEVLSALRATRTRL
jgi:hypothetical protein